MGRVDEMWRVCGLEESGEETAECRLRQAMLVLEKGYVGGEEG